MSSFDRKAARAREEVRKLRDGHPADVRKIEAALDLLDEKDRRIAELEKVVEHFAGKFKPSLVAALKACPHSPFGRLYDCPWSDQHEDLAVLESEIARAALPAPPEGGE